MASSPITSWEIGGEIVETMTDFIFLSSQITADGDCRHEIKRRLLPGRQVMSNLDNILKNRDRGRSQDGGGIGRGDHFLFYKFIERTTER